MNESFILHSTMSPKIHFKTNSGSAKTKGITKLALKKNIRRSQVHDNISLTMANDSLVLIDDSSTETESTSTKSNGSITNINATVITISSTEQSLLHSSITKNDEYTSNVQKSNCFLSDSKFASITNWVSKINNELNPLYETLNTDILENNSDTSVRKDYINKENSRNNSNEMSDNVFSNSKTDRFSSDEKDIDYLSKSIGNLQIHKHFQPKSSNINVKDQVENEVIDADVIDGSDDSFNQPNFSKMGPLTSIITKSEPRKTKKNKSSIRIPKTEVKVKSQKSYFHRNAYMYHEHNSHSRKENKITPRPAWMDRLNSLCDNDTSSMSSGKSSQAFRLSPDQRITNSEKSTNLVSNGKTDNDTNLNIKYTLMRSKVKLSFTDDDDDNIEDDINCCLPNKSDNLFENLKNDDQKIKDKSFSSSNSEQENFSDFSDHNETLEERIKKKLVITKPSVSIQTRTKLIKSNNKHIFHDNKKTGELNNDNENKELDLLKTDKTKDKKKKSTKNISTKSKSSSNKCESIASKSSSKDKNQKSFLASLSANVKDLECNPSARIFRNNFQAYKTQLANKLFTLFNDKVFNKAIPDNTPLEWNDRLRGTAGYCYCKKIIRRTGIVERSVRIALSTKILDSADRLRDTLIHELCHAATWIVNRESNGHGAYWVEWTVRARTVFPELPPIKRCHEYSINTKYTYKCVNCGYSIGRHSKSLNIERKRCGHCYGKFELLLNKTNKSGETKSVPVTPKKEPTGFALFVKDNYALVKTPQMNHAQVMKLLGQKFSEMKVTK